jgi:hypothetical protein
VAVKGGRRIEALGTQVGHNAPLKKTAAAQTEGRRLWAKIMKTALAYDALARRFQQGRTDLTKRWEEYQLDKFYKPFSSFS